jgi:hypothetical protein
MIQGTHDIKSERHRYMLNSNFKNAISASIEGKILNRDKWSMGFMYPVTEFKKYIKTKNNPDGIIDYESYIPENMRVTYSSSDAFKSKPKYTQPEKLVLMDRKELIELADGFGIEHQQYINEELRKVISDAQERWKEEKKKKTLAKKIRDLESE